MNESSNSLVLFFGRLHPLLVHLPIGGLVLLGFLELMAHLGFSKDAAQSRRTILGFVCASAAGALICGWLLGGSGGYEQVGLLKWHRWLGFGLLASCFTTSLMCWRGWMRAYSISLCATLVLLVAVGHLGGSITHGPDFLTGHLPSFSTANRAMAAQPQPLQMRPELLAQPVFTSVVQPLLQEHCVSCHNPQKHKADLRLDNYQVLLAGGLDGPVIKPGHPESSPLVQSMLSPPDADGHMPPEGQPQPTLEEIALIEWWVSAGAPALGTTSELQPNAHIRQLLEIISQRRANSRNGPVADRSLH